MRILLLRDDIYLPSYGGGIKATRYLLEGLAERGHECMDIAPAFTHSPDGPGDEAGLLAVLAERGIQARRQEPGVYRYRYRGVSVHACLPWPLDQRREYIARCIEEFQPDRIVVSDDKRRYLLASALAAPPERVVMLLQTIISLPFGPLAVELDPEQTERMRGIRERFVISRFIGDYLARHGGMGSSMLRPPVYGSGPFPVLGSFDRGYVTMINPCDLKGLPIFTGLVREFPGVAFAAVPTWGANPAVLEELRRYDNVTLLQAADDIERILERTRILLVPSLWPETFGYVVVEAMLRGIPVLASDIGGLPEAKLNVDYLLPVTPARKVSGEYIFPGQDIRPWSGALHTLLTKAAVYRDCSRTSYETANCFVAELNRTVFDILLLLNTHPN